MPVQRSKDGKGPYYQWGDSGKKYHYEAGTRIPGKMQRGRPRNKAAPHAPPDIEADRFSDRFEDLGYAGK